MKKFISMVVSAVLALMTACGNSGTGSGANLIPTSIPEYAPNTSEQAPEASDGGAEAAIGERSNDKEENALKIEITVNGRVFSATLYDNETARAFAARLPMTSDMSELNGNEKFCYMPQDLPTNSSRPSGIHAGDIMLYGSNCLVIFYEDFSTSYSYTPIGKIDDPSGLAAALGSGDVSVTFN